MYNFYPKATSKVIITIKPPIKPRVAISVNLSRCVSGITSSTTTNIIAPAAKASAYGNNWQKEGYRYGSNNSCNWFYYCRHLSVPKTFKFTDTLSDVMA